MRRIVLKNDLRYDKKNDPCSADVHVRIFCFLSFLIYYLQLCNIGDIRTMIGVVLKHQVKGVRK